MSKNKKYLTTANGTPVSDNQNSLSAGARGPLVFEDAHLFEKLAHFNRERIPERVVHAKGSGAFGELVVTHDITQFTKARLFAAVGKKRRSSCAFRRWAARPGRLILSATPAASQ